MINILVAFIMLLGSAFSLIAAIGLVRMPDIMIRMHAATKAGTFGVGLLLIAVAVHVAEITVITRVAMAILFVMLTAPLAAHLIGRAVMRAGVDLSPNMVVNEWQSKEGDQGEAHRDGAGRS